MKTSQAHWNYQAHFVQSDEDLTGPLELPSALQPDKQIGAAVRQRI